MDPFPAGEDGDRQALPHTAGEARHPVFDPCRATPQGIGKADLLLRLEALAQDVGGRLPGETHQGPAVDQKPLRNDRGPSAAA